jgi:hypothetical protein
MVVESMRMILPYWLISMTSDFSVTCAMPTTFPLRSVVFTLMDAGAAASLQAVFVGCGTFAVAVFGNGKNERTFQRQRFVGCRSFDSSFGSFLGSCFRFLDVFGVVAIPTT